MSSKWGCLGAVVVGGVGLVLFGLGFDSATTEAMPFGAVLTTVGLLLGVPSLQALRVTARPGSRPLGKLLKFSLLVFSAGLVLVGLGVQPRSTEALPFGLAALALGLSLAAVSLLSGKPALVVAVAEEDGARAPVSAEPPTSVRCANCGSPAPLRLSEPTHATCAHCDTRFALPPALVTVLRAAAVLVKAQAEAERRISAIIESIPQKHLAWRMRLLSSAGALVSIAVLVMLVAWSRRYVDDWWHRWLAMGFNAGVVALVLGGVLGKLVPRVARGIVGHWAALQLPGVPGLSCRVCGAALSSAAAPVLRCEYCSADNLAGAAVQALVAQSAGHAVRSVLLVGQKDRKADELAAFSLVAFPAVTLVAWFAVRRGGRLAAGRRGAGPGGDRLRVGAGAAGRWPGGVRGGGAAARQRGGAQVPGRGFRAGDAGAVGELRAPAARGRQLVRRSARQRHGEDRARVQPAPQPPPGGRLAGDVCGLLPVRRARWGVHLHRRARR